jgi:hypothetical protein
MAIAFDASSEGNRATNLTQTFAHTCTGSNLFLLVGVLSGAVEIVNSVTYNGVALTKLDGGKINHAANFNLDLWYLPAPATGTHNVVITMNSSSDTMGVAVSFTGVKQTGFPDAYNNYTSTTGNNPKTETLTTVDANCWMIWFGLDEFSETETAGSGTTLRQKNLGYGGVFFADSNGSVGGAGSHSLNMVPGGGSGDWMNDMVVSLAPVVVAGDLAALIGEPITGSSAIL